MRNNRCVSCGEIIPEGRQVCPNCESKATYKRLTKPKNFNQLTKHEIYNRLYILENMIENGTLIELPCKVGDKIWLIYENQVENAEIWRIVLTPTYNEFKWFIPYDETQPKDTGSFKTNEIGETVFLTKAEAEKEIKGVTK